MAHLSKKSIYKAADFFLSVFIPLLVGGLIYFWTRSHSLPFLYWIDKAFSLKPVRKLQFPDWVTFHLPDGLWTFAFCSFILIIWRRRIDKQSLLWLIVSFLVAIVLELTIGTFDFKDLWFIIAGGLLAVAIHPGNKFFITNKTKLHVHN